MNKYYKTLELHKVLKMLADLAANEKTKQIYSNPNYDWLSVGDVLADVHHLADPIAAFCGTGYQ